MEKELFTLIGIGFMASSYGIYIWSIFKRDTRPHPFSWFIWGLLTAISFFAQISDGAGVGASITALSAIITFFIAGIGYIKRDNIIISRSDKWAFALSLLAIPLWIVTETPLWSVLLITAIDVAGFYPTFRKSWFAPGQESATSYALGGFKHLFTIMALKNYSIITAFLPAVLLLMNFSFIALLFYRRWKLKYE
jgi:hypothetical protein